MNYEVASFVSMGLLKCIDRFETYTSWNTAWYIEHWKKNVWLSLLAARHSATLLVHSFVPSLCKPVMDVPLHNMVKDSAKEE